MSGGTHSLTQHEVEWFERLGQLIGNVKVLVTVAGQANEARERYGDIQKKLAEIQKTLRGATSDFRKEFEQLDGHLQQAIDQDNGSLAVETKTKLGQLRERVAEQHRLLTKERLAFLEATESSRKPLDELKKSSPSRAAEHTDRGRQIVQKVDGSDENTAATYQHATRQLQELATAIAKDQKQAEQVIGQWELVKAKVTDRLTQAQSVLTLEQSQAFAERQQKAVDSYLVDHDALKDYGELEKVWDEIAQAMKEQETLKSEFEKAKEQVDKQMASYREAASPSEYAEALQKYGVGNGLARVNKYAEAGQQMTLLNTALGFGLKEKVEAQREWEQFREQQRAAINQAIETEKKKENGRWKQTWEEYYPTTLKGDIEYSVWLGDHLKDYATAKDRLGEILKQISVIQQEFISKDTLVKEAAETAGPFMKRCVEVSDKLDRLRKKLGDDKAVAGQALGSLPSDLIRARELPKSSTQRGGYKLGEELATSLKEAEEVLRGVESELDRLLDGENHEGQQKLKELISLKDLWAEHKLAAGEHKQLEVKWQTARKTASEALDKLAQIGGAGYLKLLSEFEQTETLAADANARFKQYLALFPDAEAVKTQASLKEEAAKKYQQATTAAGQSFTNRAAKELELAGGQLDAARKELNRVKGLLDSQLRNQMWFTFGNSASSDFRTTIRQQGEQLGAYADSGNVGAIQDATKLLEKLVKQMEGLVSGSELDGFKQVVDKIAALKENLDGELLKSCKPTVQAKLASQFEKELSVNARGVSYTEGLALLTAFERDLLAPAIKEAERIHQVREALPGLRNSLTKHLATLAEKMNAIAAPQYTFPTEPPDCGEFTKSGAGLVQVIEKNEVAGVVEGALKRLQELEKLVSELAAKAPQDLVDVASAADKSIKEQQEADRLLQERKQKLLQGLASFETTDLTLVKEKSKDAEKLKLIESMIKTAKKAVEDGQILTAEEQLRSLKRMASDALLSGEGRKVEPLGPRGEQWRKYIENVNQQLVQLKKAVEEAWKADPQADQSLIAEVVRKLPEKLNLDAKALETDLTMMDEATLPIPDRKAARERLLRSLREYRVELAGNPVYQHLRDNPFDVQVATAGLLQYLSNFETKVLTTL